MFQQTISQSSSSLSLPSSFSRSNRSSLSSAAATTADIDYLQVKNNLFSLLPLCRPPVRPAVRVRPPPQPQLYISRPLSPFPAPGHFCGGKELQRGRPAATEANRTLVRPGKNPTAFSETGHRTATATSVPFLGRNFVVESTLPREEGRGFSLHL